jgi:hypothetical protein
MPKQIQAHEFNRHQPWALPEAVLPPPPARPLLPPLLAGGGSSPPGAALRPRPAGWRGWLLRRRRRRRGWKRRQRRRLGQVGYHLGPKLELDHLGLGSMALTNPDILVIGGQDGLQLQREGVRLHIEVYEYT